MELSERLELLRQTDTISGETCVQLQKLIVKTQSKWGLQLREDNAAALITHLDMARERLLKGESKGPLDNAILQEIQDSPCYSRAMVIVQGWNTFLGNLLPEAEQGYLLLHVCTLVGQEENTDA